MDPDDLPYETLVDQGCEALGILTAHYDRLWQIGSADWSLDQDDGCLAFNSPGGLAATAPAQIIGTFNTADDTWLWAWDNHSLVPALVHDAAKARAYGERHGIEPLTLRKFACTQAEAWRLTAFALRLCGAQGGYRGPAGSSFVFMTFGSVTLTQSPAPPTPVGGVWSRLRRLITPSNVAKPPVAS